MLVSIFPHRDALPSDVQVRAEIVGSHLEIAVAYPGEEGRSMLVRLRIPKDTTLRTHHTKEAHELNFYVPGKDSLYAQITVFGGYKYASTEVVEMIFEKILAEVKKALAPTEYLTELAEEILSELKKKDKVDKETLLRLERLLGMVGAK